MKNNKGFTLVELLAVVVVLGIISSIVTLSVIRIKNKAAEDACKKIEKQITDLGPQIYSNELLTGIKDYEDYCKLNGYTWDTSDKKCEDSDGNDVSDASEDYFYQKYKNRAAFIVKVGSLSEAGSLIKTGYLEEIKSPYNSETCDGYLYVDPTATDPDDMYKGFIKCGTRYDTDDYDDYNDSLPSAKLTNN